MPRPVGYRTATAPGRAGDAPLTVHVFHPAADAQETDTPLGPFTARLAAGAAPAPGPWPLVLLSHGQGSNPLACRELARGLAAGGCVVVAPVHAGDATRDDALSGTLELLSLRPRQLCAALDWALGAEGVADMVDPGRIAVVGHSAGGFTALAAAGGVPRPRPHGIDVPPVEIAPDPRLRALVLLAPATAWFLAPGALDAVSVPVLALWAERDEILPGFFRTIVENGLGPAAPLTSRTVPGAGHFAFLSPFPPGYGGPGFAPGRDPEGFDRASHQPLLAAEILAFLGETL